MNPFGLSATGLLVWGLLAHLIADWPLQSDWMAKHKAGRWISRRATRRWQAKRQGVGYVGENDRYPGPRGHWWLRHPAALFHGGIHAAVLAPVLGWPALLVAVVHVALDTRVPVVWWSRLIGQSQPQTHRFVEAWAADPQHRPYKMEFDEVAFKIKHVKEDPDRVEVLADELAGLIRDMREWTAVVDYSMGHEVRIWTDQVFHFAVIAVAAVVVAAL